MLVSGALDRTKKISKTSADIPKISARPARIFSQMLGLKNIEQNLKISNCSPDCPLFLSWTLAKTGRSHLQTAGSHILGQSLTNKSNEKSRHVLETRTMLAQVNSWPASKGRQSQFGAFSGGQSSSRMQPDLTLFQLVAIWPVAWLEIVLYYKKRCWF